MSTDKDMSKNWEVDVTVKVMGETLVLPVKVKDSEEISGRTARKMAEAIVDVEFQLSTVKDTAKAV